VSRGGRAMHVGLIAPPWLRVPPTGYGGIERVVASLRSGLRSAGHAVTLFSIEDAEELRKRHGTTEIGDSVLEEAYVRLAYAAMHNCDVVSDHTLRGPAERRRQDRAPVVATMHGPLQGGFLSQYREMAAAGAHLVSVSAAQVHGQDSVLVRARIPHGLALEEYPLGDGSGGFFLFIGRVHPHKAPHLAIEACRRAGRPIVLAGPIGGLIEQEYFDAVVRPSLGREVEYVGEVSGAERLQLLREAEALIAPNWRHEPFGLMVIEALASGTPIVAFPFGVALESVVNGANGYIVKGVDELVTQLDQVGQLSRVACRASIVGRFDTESMTSSYIRLFRRLLLDHWTPLEILR
jgi:glycosyltransferase involved in cell wall biosynthesis